ncbi:hypothetical protein KI387_022148, partial [Taxus chinensis]
MSEIGKISPSECLNWSCGEHRGRDEEVCIFVSHWELVHEGHKNVPSPGGDKCPHPKMAKYEKRNSQERELDNEIIRASGLENVTVNIGVILQLDWFGKVAKPAFELAAEEANKNSQWRLVLHFRDSQGDPVRAASAGLELLQNGAVAIIGPQTSQEAGFVAQLCDAAQVPMLSFSATDPLLSFHRFPYFLRLPHSDAVQMKAIAAVVNHYGWRQVVAVYSDNDYGTGVLSPLSEALLEVGSQIANRCPLPTRATRDYIRAELYKLMTMPPRVFVVHMTLELGESLFSVANDIGMMEEDYVWIITDGISTVLDALNPSIIDSMKGALATRTYIPSSSHFANRWRDKFTAEFPHEGIKPAKMNIYAFYAYDAVSIIARAVHKLNSTGTRFSFSPSPLSQVKVFQQGARLLQLLSETDYVGISGRLRAREGELGDCGYQILNVIGGRGESESGKGYRVVGFWKDGLQGIRNTPVRWPGGSESVPRGWATPEALKIAVPVKHGFEEFVVTTRDQDNKPKISGGFVIDVFAEVVKSLPYAFSYKLIPYGDGNVTPSYDELVQKVYTKKYDALVGDFTILANRSKYVDFTQPYSESGLAMVVAIQKADSSNPWAFLRPFTPGMWIATGGFFLFTGIVVWLLEHRRNNNFRGKPRRQIVTLLWFSFSTLFFAQRERIVSSLARGVIIIWLFVVLILTSSYTASLTSILTVQQMEPSITDMQCLVANRAPVGYQRGSFVGHYLQEQLNFHETQLKQYSSPDEYAEALSKGPNNGGVAAIFDELPYIRLFLSTRCGFTMVGPTYRTGGLAFVFRKGSPWVSEISRSVLKLSESADMQRIQNKWFNMTACITQSGAPVESNRLSMKSFWGLYLITGTASVVALVSFIGRLLYKYTRGHGHSPSPSASPVTPSISSHFKSF